MLNAISNILNAITSIWNYLKSIPKAFASVITWAENGFDNLVRDVEDLYIDIVTYAQQDINYAYGLYKILVSYIQGEFSDLYNWALNNYLDVLHYAEDVYTYAINSFINLEKWASNEIGDVISWVERDVIDPFLDAIDGLLNWIDTYGAFMLNLLTHPELLAELIAKYLLGAWLSLGRQFAVPFFKWFYHSAMSYAPDFADILEEIISSLFD